MRDAGGVLKPVRPRRAIVLAATAAALAGLLGFVSGVDLGHTAALGLVAAAMTLAVQMVPPAPSVGWTGPPESDEGTGWHQARLLARTLEQLDAEPERVSTALLPRLRAVASARLGRLGVVADSPRARELIGPELYDRLGGVGPARQSAQPSAGTATALTRALLDRLDAIDPPDRPAAAAHAGTGTGTGTAKKEDGHGS